MARALTATKLPLDRWARIMGVNPLHFNQVQLTGAGGGPNLQKGTCSQAWFQHDYQDVDRVGREQVAAAIREAEDRIEAALHWRLMPAWEASEWATLPKPYRPELWNLTMTDVRGMPIAVEPAWHKLITPGIRAVAAVGAGVAIAWSDVDGDGYDETGTVIVNVAAGTQAHEIVVVYPGEAATTDWQIRPITVALAGAVATITFRRELAVLPELLEEFGASAVDGLVDASFLGTVDVWRVYNDPSTQAVLQWEPGAACDCSNGQTCPTCEIATQAACMTVRGTLETGRWALQPATWVEASSSFTPATLLNCRAADSVRLNYQAGDRTGPDLLTMAPKWERAVALFAASLLERNPCDCNADWWRMWREDLANYGGQDQENHFTISDVDLGCPWGTRRGALHAWKAVRENGAAINPAGILVR